MRIYLHINSDFECVYLINGHFNEKADNIILNDDEIMFLSVLPLEAQFLPYTVKFVGGKAISNNMLVCTYVYKSEHYIINLSKRYNYVYAPIKEYSSPPDIICQFFDYIKKGELNQAKIMLSPDLASTIDDNSLVGFFADFANIVPNKNYISLPSSYFLIDASNNAFLYQFIVNNGLIDNIIEKE